VTIIFAAGNGNEDISDPDSFDGFAANGNVIAVGAVNADGIRSAYSDFGKDLDVVSPSSDIDSGYVWDPYATDINRHGIWTIDARSWYGYSQMDYTSSFGGTSSATPLVSGIVGMMISLYPDVTAEEIREILISSADKVSPTDAQYDEDGFSNFYGYGRINAFKAVEMLCEMKECNGGLDPVDEDTYPSRELDEDFINDIDIETGDDVLIPDSRTVSGCSLTTIF
jgi:subtilisin family serine protease